jgi:hypothetical protein
MTQGAPQANAGGSINDGPAQLHQLSVILQQFSQAIVDAYKQATTTDEILQLSKIQNSLEHIQLSLGHLRTLLLAGFTTDLSKFTAALNDQLAKLQGIVDTINNVNQLIDIATEVAQIAAGIMKM